MNTTKDHNIKQKDAAILREALASIHRKAPAGIQKQINDVLSRYANSVKEYCQHPEQVFIGKENAFACLDCGNRNKTLEVKEDDPKSN